MSIEIVRWNQEHWTLWTPMTSANRDQEIVPGHAQFWSIKAPSS
jgi:hypothetical protein